MNRKNNYAVYVNGAPNYSNIPKAVLEPLVKTIAQSLLQQLKEEQGGSNGRSTK